MWQNLPVSVYPAKVSDRCRSLENVGVVANASAAGKSASFVCGSFASVSVRIDDTSGSIEEARYRTNGCGFMMAAADVLASWLRHTKLTDLHGLTTSELMNAVSTELGEFPADRIHCVEVVLEALRDALRIYRDRRIEEFRGEEALICTCFGVSEATVISVIAGGAIQTVDEVAEICRAGAGCGSCRMLVQDLIDARIESV